MRAAARLRSLGHANAIGRVARGPRMARQRGGSHASHRRTDPRPSFQELRRVTSQTSLLLFGLASIFPLWIMTSFDAAAHASEETLDAARNGSRAMVTSVAGWSAS